MTKRRARDPVVRAESAWSLVALALGACGVVLGTIAQLVSKTNDLRPLWFGLVGTGAVVALPALVLQSPWWRDRWRTRRARRRDADDDEAARRALQTSGRGVLGPDWSGQLFTGRSRALAALTGFLTDDTPERVRVVVGQPGSGKSALLGRLIALTGPDGPIDGVVHVRGRDAGHVLRVLGGIAGRHEDWPEPDRPLPDLVDDLRTALRDTPVTRTVVIDALDEAIEPQHLVRELIRPLVHAAPEVRLRLVVGVRRNLLRLLDVPATAVIDLDSDDYFDLADLTEYTLRCMTTGSDRPSGDLRDVAAAVATRAAPVFLIAQLTARALTGEADPAARWRTSFPSRVGTAMDALLARFPESTRVRDLLTPLAFAEGSGLLPGPIWAALASAVGVATYRDQDVRWLREDSPAADLLLGGAGPADGGYRLFHEALAEHLRERCPHHAPQEAVTRALIESVPRDGTGHQWRDADPYVRAHLATHAARSGLLDDLVADPAFLLAAEPDALLRVLPLVTRRTARRTAAVYRGIVHQLRDCPADEAAALFGLHARQQRHDALVHRLDALPGDRPWLAAWVRARPTHPHQVIGRHDTDVNAMVAVTVDEVPHVIVGDAGGAVTVWNLDHGARRGRTVRAPGGEVTAVAGGFHAGAFVLVLAGDEGLWTARDDGRELRRIGTRTGIRSVAVASAGAGLAIVTGDADGRLAVYDLATGTDRVAPLQAHDDAVLVLAVADRRGRPMVVSGAADGSVAAWHADDGSRIAVLRRAATDAVAALVAPGGDAPDEVTVAGLDGIVRTWNLTTATSPGTPQVLAYDGWLNCLTPASFGGAPGFVGGALDGRTLVWRDDAENGPEATLAGHDGWIGAVTAVARHGRDLVLTGGLDGTVRAWDLADLDLVAGPGEAHDGEVTALALLRLPDGRPVTVSAGTDGTIRLWDAGDGTPAADPIPAHDHGVRALTVTSLAGRPAIVSGGNDGTLRVWDARTGEPRGPAIKAHHRTVRSVAPGRRAGRPVLLTGGDGGVRLWDARSGAEIGVPLAAGDDIHAVAVARDGGRQWVVAAGAERLHRYDLATGAPAGPAIETGARAGALAVTRVGGRPVVVAGVDGAGVRCWDLVTGGTVARPLPTADRTRSLAVPADRPVVVTGDDQGLWIHALDDRRPARRIRLGFRASALAVPAASEVLVGSPYGLYSLRIPDGA